MLDGHFRAELVREFLLEALDVRVAAVLAFSGGRRRAARLQPANQRFGVADRKTLLRDETIPEADGPADTDVAQCDTYCVAHHVSADTDMILGLRYVDRFEKRSGSWLIAKRVCAFDWTYTLPYDPAKKFVFEPDFTVGHRDRTDITYRGV